MAQSQNSAYAINAVYDKKKPKLKNLIQQQNKTPKKE